jgi:hypothetical protein
MQADETAPMTWEFCRSCGGGGWVGSRIDHKHPGCGHRCILCNPPPGYDPTYAAATRRCTTCERVQPVDWFGNPHAPDICEGCYRAIGVDIWAAGDE